METNTMPKNFWLWIVFIIIVGISGYFYGPALVKFFTTKEKPYMTVKPESYPQGTVVMLYKNTAPDFPQNVILEQKPLSYSGQVNNPDGKKQITVIYSSDTEFQKLVTLYTTSLPKLNWSIVNSKNSSQHVAVLQLSQGTKNMIVTFTPSPATTTSTVVTFQYQM